MQAHIKLWLLKQRDVAMDELAQANESYPDFENIDLLPEVRLYSPEAENPCGPYLLRLSVEHTPDTSSKVPYIFEVTIEGIFELEELEKSEEECKRLVVINGGSMLYSAAREQLFTLSGRLLYGSMLLPSLDFRKLASS